MSGSLSTFYSPRITGLPSTASTAQEVKYHAAQVTRAINGLPNFSIFSWSTPESNETAQYPALGFNLAPASVTSGLWFKALGSGMTGWYPVMYGPEEEDASAHVHNSASSFPVSKNSATVLTFSVVDFDTASVYDGVSKFVVPSTGNITGTWEFRGHITWAPDPAGGRQCDIYRNGVVLYSNHVLGSNDTQSQHIAGMVHNPAAGTYFQLVVTQSSAATLNILTEPEHTFFEMLHL